RSPGIPGPSLPRPGPAWPAPARARSFPRPPRMESPARSRARRRPLPARARLARPSETDRRRPPNTAHAPDHKDPAARAPTPGPRGGGPGLAPDTQVTRGAVRHGFGSPHPHADTTRVPGCRRAPPRALPVLWPSSVLRRGLCTGLRLAGYAQASLAASSGSRALSREVGNGFHIGGTLRSPLACPLPIADSPCAKTRFGAVVNQQFRLRLNGSWKPFLEGHGNPGMEVLPATAQQGAVSGVLYERMLEGV